jgi:hypothetical protein
VGLRRELVIGALHDGVNCHTVKERPKERERAAMSGEGRRRKGEGQLLVRHTGAGLLAEAAVDALGHVDVITRRFTAPVLARGRLDRDGLRAQKG